jgi:peroxiredoxin 2/4
MSRLIGRPAPDFVAPALRADGALIERYHLRTAIRGRCALLFFNPYALTFVCASELPALDRRYEAFRRYGVEVLGLTLDAQCRHSIWRNIPAEHLPALRYDLVVDVHGHICRDYGLRTTDASCAFRGAFLLDPQGLVRYQAINDLPLQRELDELLIMVDALKRRSATDLTTSPTRMSRDQETNSAVRAVQKRAYKDREGVTESSS